MTEGSFDTYMWQTLERKARFINQVMRGRVDLREIEDLGEDVLGFAELKAIASGDPLILDKAKIDAEVERLSRVERAWQRGHHALRSTIAAAEQRAGALDRQIAAIHETLPRVRDTRGELFAITVGDRTYPHRTAGAAALARHLQGLPIGPARHVAQLAGLQVDAELRGDHHGQQYLTLTLHGLPTQPATLKRSQLADARLSLIRQLEHRAQTLPELATQLAGVRDEALREATAAIEQLARPFKYADQLLDARRGQQRIDQQIAEHHERQEAEHAAATADVDVDADAAIALADRVHPPSPAPTADDMSCRDPGDVSRETADTDLDPQTAESLRLLHASQARQIGDAVRDPPAANPSARPPTRSPSRSTRPRR